MVSQTSPIFTRTVASAAIALAIACTCRASTLYVDDDAPVKNADGLTWPSAFRHLQDALASAAQPGSGITEIRVAGGAYRPDESSQSPTGTGDRNAAFYMLADVTIKGGYAGLANSKNPDLRDLDLYPTI